MNPALAPDAQLKPPGYDPKPFQEALTDFNARKYQRENLAHSVQVGSSYPMLSQQEVAEFRASRSSATASNSSGTRYSGCAGVSYFSDVYFSARHTAALVYMLNWCGSLCGQGEWIYVEKRERPLGAAVRSGRDCFRCTAFLGKSFPEKEDALQRIRLQGVFVGTGSSSDSARTCMGLPARRPDIRPAWATALSA